jgi:hypothetical protein
VGLHRGGGLPDSESISSLHYLVLDVELLGTSSRSLPLPKSVSSLKMEADAWPWLRHPRWDHCHGLSARSILQPWGGCDGSRWIPSVVPSGRGGWAKPSSRLESMWNSSVESSIMARNGDGGSPWVGHMRVASKLLPLDERLRPPK